jgi:hypothetical protein
LRPSSAMISNCTTTPVTIVTHSDYLLVTFVRCNVPLITDSDLRFVDTDL